MKKSKWSSGIISFFVAIMMLVTTNAFAQDQQDQNKDDQQKTQPQEQVQDQQNNQQQQKFDKIAEDLSKDLQSKVDLSDQQVAQVQTILVDYQSDIMATADLNKENSEDQQNNTDQTAMNEDPVQKANSRIEALLDDTQKAKWENVKTDWWKEVNDQVSNNKTTL